MKSFLIVGLGRFGASLAQELCEQGHEVLALDVLPERVQAVADHVTHAVVGDARDPEVLSGVGARTFDCAVVAAGSDVGTSALITLNLKELNGPRVVGKANSSVHRKVLEKIGADLVVFPEQEMALSLARRLINGDIVNFIELSNEYSIVERTLPESWVGKSIVALNIRAKWKLTVIAVRRGDAMTIAPGGDFVFQSPEDCLVVLGRNSDIERLERA